MLKKMVKRQPGEVDLELYIKGYEKMTRTYIEQLLQQAESGILKLQNVTKVMFKKILEYLPK